MCDEFACPTKGSLIITGLRLNSECGCSLHAPLSLQGSERLALVGITLHVCGTAIKCSKSSTRTVDHRLHQERGIFYSRSLLVLGSLRGIAFVYTLKTSYMRDRV